MAGKKRKRPKNGMLITNIRTKTSVILWSFLAIFAVGGVFGMFGMDIIGSRLGLNKPQQKLQNAKVKIPKTIVKVDDTALGDELFNDLYIRMLEMSDIRDVGRNYFYRTFLKSQALDSMIQQQIFLEEAKKRKIRVTSGEVNKALRTYRDFILGESSRLEDPGLPARAKFFFEEKERDKAMQEILMRRGVSGKTFKQAMRREATLRNAQKQLLEEAKAKEQAEAKKRAQDVLTKVKAGEAFFTLAREFSEDLSTRENGGDRGWSARGTWEKEFENAAFSMAPGQTSDLVKSDSGFHIIRVEGKKVAVGPDFEREKPALL
ncbi:MAG: peptidylprolyl isomerase, partial [bacterium]